MLPKVWAQSLSYGQLVSLLIITRPCPPGLLTIKLYTNAANMELHNLDLVQIDLMLELTLGKFWSYQKSKSWLVSLSAKTDQPVLFLSKVTAIHLLDWFIIKKKEEDSGNEVNRDGMGFICFIEARGESHSCWFMPVFKGIKLIYKLPLCILNMMNIIILCTRRIY